MDPDAAAQSVILAAAPPESEEVKLISTTLTDEVTAPRRKHYLKDRVINRLPERNPYEPVHGEVVGFPVGSTFERRFDCSEAGVHAPLIAGIHGTGLDGQPPLPEPLFPVTGTLSTNPETASTLATSDDEEEGSPEPLPAAIGSRPTSEPRENPYLTNSRPRANTAAMYKRYRTNNPQLTYSSASHSLNVASNTTNILEMPYTPTSPRRAKAEVTSPRPSPARIRPNVSIKSEESDFSVTPSMTGSILHNEETQAGRIAESVGQCSQKNGTSSRSSTPSTDDEYPRRTKIVSETSKRAKYTDWSLDSDSEDTEEECGEYTD
ncbi:hypothetical protein H0H81_002703 [Sphagnurus paluster]|uniref:Uncharacterized protein n=1 Tax=Sphagnurus paluster TaxID=117069 RepID=A0A9P7KLR5_9AGAR|nr:hypothetical protein H0H81_002703 [Sphagnurus paluster]